MSWIVSQRLARQLDSFGEVAILARHRGKVVMGIRVGRVDAQHVGISGGCLGDDAAPVQRQCLA